MLSIETLYFPTTRLYLWRGLEDKKFLYIVYSAQLSSYKRRLFTASEEMSHLLTTHKEKYWLQEKVKCGFYHSILFWDRLTRSIFQSFLGENTAQIPKLSIYYFSLVMFNSNQHWLLLRQLFVSFDLPEKSRFFCCHLLFRDMSLGELLPLRFLCARFC